MRSLLLVSLVLAASSLSAQTRGSASHAAATITAEDVTQRIGVIADDSMMGRDTPSRGLDLTAQYVADRVIRVCPHPSTLQSRSPVSHCRIGSARSAPFCDRFQ